MGIKEEPEEEEELPEDSRTQIIAAELVKLYSMWEIKQSIIPEYKNMYERCSMVSDSMVWLLVVILFITKPAWCHEKTGFISEDCKIDSKGNKYHMSNIPLLSPTFTLFFGFILMILVVMIQAVKSRLSGSAYVTRKLILEICITGVTIAMYLLSETFSLISKFNGDNIVKILFLVFVLVHNQTMWNGIKDLLSLIVSGYLGLFLFFAN